MHPKELRRHLLLVLLSPALAIASATGTVDLRTLSPSVIVLAAGLVVAAFAAGVLLGRVTQRGHS